MLVVVVVRFLVVAVVVLLLGGCLASVGVICVSGSGCDRSALHGTSEGGRRLVPLRTMCTLSDQPVAAVERAHTLGVVCDVESDRVSRCVCDTDLCR